MNEIYYCPICGCILENEFNIGTICPCCGNDSEFDDDIDKEDINYDEYFKILNAKIEAEKNGEKPSHDIIEYLENSRYEKEEAWLILRKKWIESGYKWRFDPPIDWNVDIARKQLRNILD